MELLDIIQLAGVKSGVISTFNPGEMPEDFEGMARELFIRDILPGINCDRNLDVTDTALTLTPVDGVVVLKSIPQDSGIIVLGESTTYTSEYLTSTDPLSRQETALSLFGVSEEGDFPTSDAGDPIPCGIWTADDKFFKWNQYPMSMALGSVTDFNVKFPPMRVHSVFDDSTRLEFEFVYRDEFEGPEFHDRRDVYTVEEYEDSLKIIFNDKSAKPKRIVFPVPITVTKSLHGYSPSTGIVHAPAKFEKYLTEILAVELAVLYGLSTAEVLSKSADIGYSRLVKAGRRTHGQDINRKIGQYLGRSSANDFVR